MHCENSIYIFCNQFDHKLQQQFFLLHCRATNVLSKINSIDFNSLKVLMIYNQQLAVGGTRCWQIVNMDKTFPGTEK